LKSHVGATAHPTEWSAQVSYVGELQECRALVVAKGRRRRLLVRSGNEENCWQTQNHLMHAGTHGRLNDGLRGGALSNRAMFCETALCPHATSSSVDFRGQNGLGIAQMQRAYALRRKSGDLIFLFEDRALATLLKTSLFGDIATNLAARAGVPLRDLGMVEGSGGFLGVRGAHAGLGGAVPYAGSSIAALATRA
jgi:hypothetical protein